MKKIAAVVVVALALAGCSASNYSNVGKHFICEDDTALTEHHHGIKRAWVRSSGLWSIVYTTGQSAYYMQPTGETCRLITAEEWPDNPENLQ